MATPIHLVKRFVGTAWPAGPKAIDAEWAESNLIEGERELWGRMKRADRRHAAAVARRVEAALGAEATRPVLAAALLHDAGKVESGLGTFARVGATVLGAVSRGTPISRRPRL
jgi:hypothetical protein